jgi:hypothetical protein
MSDTLTTPKVASKAEKKTSVKTSRLEKSRLTLTKDERAFIHLIRSLPAENITLLQMVLANVAANAKPGDTKPIFTPSRILECFPDSFGPEEQAAIRALVTTEAIPSPVLRVSVVENTPQAFAFHLKDSDVCILMVRPGTEREDGLALAQEIAKTGGEPLKVSAGGQTAVDMRVKGWEDGPVFHLLAVIGEINKEGR